MRQGENSQSNNDPVDGKTDDEAQSEKFTAAELAKVVFHEDAPN
jgi:hypothetical protein